jgi:glycosyltransferase involved in cell wall biosynthesis
MNCSVIICTHNRAESLKKTIEAVMRQDYILGTLEVLIIDNCSTDHTSKIADMFLYDKHPIRYIYEDKPGLSHARNCGLCHAKGEIVIFIDDDALPVNSDWATRLAQVYTDPEICAAGGDLTPIWPNGRRPQWLHDFFMPPLGLTQFNYQNVALLTYPSYPWGANISYRKSCVQQFNGFSVELGWSTAKKMPSGEETELNYKIEQAGKKILYVPNAVVNHLISEEKLTFRWLLNRADSQGRFDSWFDIRYRPRFYVLMNLFRQFANIAVHFLGVRLFFLLANQKMQLYCRYNQARCMTYVKKLLWFLVGKRGE